MNNLSVVILSFNCGDFLRGCLESLYKVKNEADLDIWVVDNHSTDGSLEKVQKDFPRVHFIINEGNFGFAKGNNVGLKKGKDEMILVLNPDTKVLPGTLKYMLEYMKNNPDVGAASCRVELTDGSLDWASHRGVPTPWASLLYFIAKNDTLYHLTKNDMSKVHEVDGITGAFFLTRKSVLDRVGLFDEDYFMYAEDLDLCYRIKKAGYKIMYVPQVKVIHFKGISSGIKQHSQGLTTATLDARIRAMNAFYETMKIFYKKNLSQNYFFLINWLVYLGIDLRLMLVKRKLKV